MTRTISGSVAKGGEEPFKFVANYRCLDFVNTESKKSGEIIDLLRTCEDFVKWLEFAKLFERHRLNPYPKGMGRDSGERLFKQAVRFRDVLDKMASQIVAGHEVPRSALQAINALIRRPLGTTRLVKTPQGYSRRFEPDLSQETQLLVPIAQSAADLLCGADRSRVKQCANPGCGAFFYDTSRNRRRRWCSASTCGNRMRVSAFYERHRKGENLE